MQPRIFVPVPNALFAAGLVMDVGLDVNLSLPAGAQSAGQSGYLLVESIVVRAQDNLGYDIWFWNSATHIVGTDPDSDAWLGHWAFDATDAATALSGDTSPTPYRYFTFGNDLPIFDRDTLAKGAPLGKVHMTVIPRGGSVTAGHALTMLLGLRPQYGAW